MKAFFPHRCTRSYLRKLLTVRTENGMNSGSQKNQQFPRRQITKEGCRIFSSKHSIIIRGVSYSSAYSSGSGESPRITFYLTLKDWDGRIDHRNKEWAKTIPIFEDNNGFGDNRNREFVVDRAHPGLLDLFVTQARREYLLTQPLTKEEIHAEAAKVLSRLQAPREPNSPNGTHFIAEVSLDFLNRAKDKDRDKFYALLPFDSLALSTINDRKGIFAMISKDENRSQPLRERRPSVLKKLKETQPVKAAAPKKSKEMEL